MGDEKARVGILISGRGSNMRSLIAASGDAHCPYRVIFVGSNDPAAAGLDFARDAGISVWSQSHRGMARATFDDLIDAALRDAGVELIALAGYMRILSAPFIARWEGRIVNIHPSLLPRHKGLDTHARAIAAGDTEAGCSVHIVTAELDDGPVLAQARVPIVPGDTPETLAERVLAEEHRLYPAALANYVRRMRPG